jgi:hypothetical protein
VYARLVGLTELGLFVSIDEQLAAVETTVHGLPGDWQALLAPSAALDFTLRLMGAIHRGRHLGDETPIT